MSVSQIEMSLKIKHSTDVASLIIWRLADMCYAQLYCFTGTIKTFKCYRNVEIQKNCDTINRHSRYKLLNSARNTLKVNYITKAV